MDLEEIKAFAAQAKKVTAGASTGPRTQKGKLRSSLNAVRHGLAATHMLLPGEDAAEYERRMDALFVALDPKDDAQAQLVALVADDLWKLERLSKIEQGVTLGRIEELLGHTESSEDANTAAHAMKTLGAALTLWAEEPLPAERNGEYQRRLRALSAAIDLVSGMELGVPTNVLERCDALLMRLFGQKGESAVPMDAYAEVYQAAREVMGRLIQRGDRINAVQEDLRKAIATLALPDEPELKKLGRYRKILEEGLQRRLAALEQMRKLAASSEMSEAEKTVAREHRVKLRVVA